MNIALDLDVATGLTPSLVGLLVVEACRGQGIASALIRSAASLAGRFGHERVYISTTLLGAHLLRNGWRLFDAATFLNDEQGAVYAYDLVDSTR